MKQVFLPLGILACMILSSCASMRTTEPRVVNSLMGAAIGTGIGVGLAAVDPTYSATKSALLLGGIGSALGYVVTSALENQEEIAREKSIVTREARKINIQQLDIEASRDEVYESTTWGGGETRSWEERYQIDESDSPYQGAGM